MYNEHELVYTYYKDDDKHPEPISLRAPGKFEKIDSYESNRPGHFKRVTKYENGMVISEEMLPGEHIFRFNKPYKEVEPGVLVFE
jgi:hypothetical protein